MNNIQKGGNTLSELLDAPQGPYGMNQMVKKSYLPYTQEQLNSNAQNWQLPEFAGGISTAPPLNKRDQKVM